MGRRIGGVSAPGERGKPVFQRTLFRYSEKGGFSFYQTHKIITNGAAFVEYGLKMYLFVL